MRSHVPKHRARPRNHRPIFVPPPVLTARPPPVVQADYQEADAFITLLQASGAFMIAAFVAVVVTKTSSSVRARSNTEQLSTQLFQMYSASASEHDDDGSPGGMAMDAFGSATVGSAGAVGFTANGVAPLPPSLGSTSRGR